MFVDTNIYRSFLEPCSLIFIVCDFLKTKLFWFWSVYVAFVSLSRYHRKESEVEKKREKEAIVKEKGTELVCWNRMEMGMDS